MPQMCRRWQDSKAQGGMAYGDVTAQPVALCEESDRRFPKGIVQKRLPSGELPKAKLPAMLDDGKPFGRVLRHEMPPEVSPSG